jgi:hypothetical protein
VDNGVACKRDRDCSEKRCRLFPDGDKYCVAEQKSCVLPGGDGAPAGAVIALHQQCYECAPGIGWKLCGERTWSETPGEGDHRRVAGAMSAPVAG